MKLYDGFGPNPKIVRMLLAEKGVSLPISNVNIKEGENRQAPFIEKNPYGQIPVLELDTGHVVAEVAAICEYLEEIYPAPAFIGATAEERSAVRMWLRRIDLTILQPMINGFRFSDGLPFFQTRMLCIPDAAPQLKETAKGGLRQLESCWPDGRKFICGDAPKLPDLMLFAYLSFFRKTQPIDTSLKEITQWFGVMGDRASATA